MNYNKPKVRLLAIAGGLAVLVGVVTIINSSNFRFAPENFAAQVSNSGIVEGESILNPRADAVAKTLCSYEKIASQGEYKEVARYLLPQVDTLSIDKTTGEVTVLFTDSVTGGNNGVDVQRFSPNWISQKRWQAVGIRDSHNPVSVNSTDNTILVAGRVGGVWSDRIINRYDEVGNLLNTFMASVGFGGADIGSLPRGLYNHADDKVTKYDFTNGVVLDEWSHGGTSDVTADLSGRIYVASGKRIYQYTGDGDLVDSNWNKDPLGKDIGFLAVDYFNNVYTISGEGSNIDKFDPQGKKVATTSTYAEVHAMDVDANGCVYVTDYKKSIVKYCPTGPDACARITVTKDIQDSPTPYLDPTPFSFYIKERGGTAKVSFELNDDPDPGLSDTRTIMVDPGKQFEIFEINSNDTTDYKLTGISCTPSGIVEVLNDPVTGVLGKATVTTPATQGLQDVRCTFTNKRPDWNPGNKGRIIIKKILNTQSRPTEPFPVFDFTTNFQESFSLDNNENDATYMNSKTFVLNNVSPYTYPYTEYSFTEGISNEYRLEDISCESTGILSEVTSDLESRQVDIQLAAGETVTCTFVNTPLPIRP